MTILRILHLKKHQKKPTLILHQINVREKAYRKDYIGTSSSERAEKLQKEKAMQEVHSSVLDNPLSCTW